MEFGIEAAPGRCLPGGAVNTTRNSRSTPTSSDGGEKAEVPSMDRNRAAAAEAASVSVMANPVPAAVPINQDQQCAPAVAVGAPVSTPDPSGAIAGIDLSSVCDPLHTHVAMTALQPQQFATPLPGFPPSASTGQAPQEHQTAVWLDALVGDQFLQQQSSLSQVSGISQGMPSQQQMSHRDEQNQDAFNPGSLSPMVGGGLYLTGPNRQQILVGPEMAASLQDLPTKNEQQKHSGLKRPRVGKAVGKDARGRKTARQHDEHTQKGPSDGRGKEKRAAAEKHARPSPNTAAASSRAAATAQSPSGDVDLDCLTPAKRRRHERNLREQQRSQKITEQIKELREVLAESKFPFKPNKFSILLSVAEYIKQLQARAVLLDQEHRRLVDTLRITKEMVNEGRVPSEEDIGEESAGCAPFSSSSATEAVVDDTITYSAEVGNDADMLFVQGIDYKSLFAQCSAPLGVASLDGRFVACNAEFEIVSGFAREELARQSLFNLLTSKDMQQVCEVMGCMLGRTCVDNASADGSDSSQQTFWSGSVLSKQSMCDLIMNISLVRTTEGIPKFFNCALSPR
mmetsp:Transcript_34579/g.75702  ORF Transcript_34579/g.75702 Transcript_34579/m.75702 type:complete len:569 (+) Transcript_34579:275-1981(+)